MNESDEQLVLLFEADRETVNVLLDCVNQRLQTWSGGEPQEQERLKELKDLLFKGSLEFQFDD